MNCKPIKLELWQCPICRKVYNEHSEAQECVDKGFNPTMKVGDLLLMPPKYAWFDGDPEWVVQNTGKHHDTDLHSFYYVVTHVDGDDRNGHRPRYHLRTLAMSSQGTSGYTYDEQHVKPVLAPPTELSAKFMVEIQDLIALGPVSDLL